MATLSGSQWEEFTSQHPDVHILQTTAWGDLKKDFGWDVERIRVENLGAQILFRKIIPGLTLAYVPKGPVGLNKIAQAGWQEFMQELDRVCRKKHVFFLKIEPDVWQSGSTGDSEQHSGNFPSGPFFGNAVPAGLRPSLHSIQPPRTILVSLNDSEDQILNRMKQKTRYNIRLAQRSEVKVTLTNDLDLFAEMMAETGERDQFGVHNRNYYLKSYALFHARSQCELLLASFQDEPLAMLMVFSSGQRAWYLYGASRNIHREKMPAYLLQWEAMRWAKEHGSTSYDLWGVPDEDLETLEVKFANISTGLWGVYRFKRGFGGSLLRSAGPWDRVYNPTIYRFYLYWVNRSKRDVAG